jgi:hypothetical protein
VLKESLSAGRAHQKLERYRGYLSPQRAAAYLAEHFETAKPQGCASIRWVVYAVQYAVCTMQYARHLVHYTTLYIMNCSHDKHLNLKPAIPTPPHTPTRFVDTSLLQFLGRPDKPYMIMEEEIDSVWEKYNGNSGYCSPQVGGSVKWAQWGCSVCSVCSAVIVMYVCRIHSAEYNGIEYNGIGHGGIGMAGLDAVWY